MSRIDDIAASGSDLLLVVEAQGPLAGAPIVLFSVLLLLQGHRRLPVTAFAIGAAAGYVLAPNLLSMLQSVGIDSPLDMAQSQVACAIIIGVVMVSVAQTSLRMMAGLLAFIGITAGVQALYVRGIDIEQGEFIPIIAALATWYFTRSVRRLLPTIAAAAVGSVGLLVGVFILLEMPVMTLHPGASTTIWFAIPIAGMSFVYQHRAAKKRAQKKELEGLMKDPSMKNLTDAQKRERALEVQARLKAGRSVGGGGGKVGGKGTGTVRRRRDPLEQYLTPYGKSVLDREVLENSRRHRRQRSSPPTVPDEA
ncbi:MAG: hypothetical protein ACPHX2_03720 [Candidatus Poseidoniaceae archaeon]